MSAANRKVYELSINSKQQNDCKKKEAENGWLLAQLHGNFTPAHADGCGARCFAGVQCASLIILPAYHRPQAATPVLRPGFVALLFSRGPVLRTCNRVMAHRPYGSIQDRMYPSALYCAGGLPPGFLCQGAIKGRRVERGTHSARFWISSGQNPGWR